MYIYYVFCVRDSTQKVQFKKSETTKNGFKRYLFYIRSFKRKYRFAFEKHIHLIKIIYEPLQSKFMEKQIA